MLIVAAPVAFAGPGFVDSARVSSIGSGDESGADVEVRFNCKAQYLRHEPQGGGDRLRIYLDPTGICNGVSPVVAESRIRLRPLNADSARLLDLEYDGGSTGEPVLTLSFSEPVDFDVDMVSVAFGLVVHIRPSTTQPLPHVGSGADPTANHRQVARPKENVPEFVINLASLRRLPTIADALDLRLADDQRLYYSEFVIDRSTWYRLRLGDFKSAEEADIALAQLKTTFPGAWIDQVGADENVTELSIPAQTFADEPIDTQKSDDSAGSKVDSMMDEARKSIAAGDTSRAIQLYTKVLQQPEHPRLP